MRRILLPCALSLLAYAILFGLVLDRPLSLGFLRWQIEARLARGGEIEGPKLVIVAGSNGPYSHRCETIEPIAGVPCVNAGVAVGIGLDYLFARWKPLLRPGDTVYLPLEEAQYARTPMAISLGPDASIMFRHDRVTLMELGPERLAGAVFSFGPRAALMSLIETALVAGGFEDPRAAAVGSSNRWGDHVGHTPELGRPNQAALATVIPMHETPARIASGGGTAQVRTFLEWASTRGVRVIGGLQAGFGDHPMPAATKEAIKAIFVAGKAGFIDLGERDRYPRTAFFDTPDHLNEPAQIARSRDIGAELAAILAPARAASR